MSINVMPIEPVVEPAAVRVKVGIDAAITAKHQVAVRETAADGSVSTQRFAVSPTLAGLEVLSTRLARYPGCPRPRCCRGGRTWTSWP